MEVVERRALPIAAIVVAMRNAGRESASDPAGLSALVARTVLSGVRLGNGQVVAMPSVHGRALTVLQNDDATLFGIEVVAGAVPLAIELVASVVSRPVLDVPAFDFAMNQQLDAAAEQSRSRFFHLQAASLQSLYGVEHVLARAPLGTQKTLRTISASKVSAFYRARYRPSSTGLFVVGDVEAERVFELAERHLGSWAADGSEPGADTAPRVRVSQARRSLMAFSAGGSTATVLLTVPGPGHLDADRVPFDLVGTALSGSALSRGNRELSHHDVKSYGVWSLSHVRARASELFLGFTVEPEDLGESLARMLDLMASVGERPFAAPELERVRAHHLGNLSDMHAKNSTFALHLAELFGQGGSPGEFARLYERVRSVTSAELQRAAVAWFRRDRVQVAVVANPYENGRTLRRFGNVEWFELEVQTVE